MLSKSSKACCDCTPFSQVPIADLFVSDNVLTHTSPQYSSKSIIWYSQVYGIIWYSEVVVLVTRILCNEVVVVRVVIAIGNKQQHKTHGEMHDDACHGSLSYIGMHEIGCQEIFLTKESLGIVSIGFPMVLEGF
jgi:hypothetical protein